MRKPSRTCSTFLTVAFICGTVSTNAQEIDSPASTNAPQTSTSDLAGLLATARSQLPNELEAGSVQTYLDGLLAYIYGYSLMAIALTERVSTNVANADQQYGRAPINQLYKAPNLPVGSAFKDIVLPSTTTLYAVGFFNLEQEPLLLHLPAISSDRFFIVQLLDAWTNVSRKSPSSRLSSNTPGDYALVGPDWNGKLPNRVTETIRFDTNTVWQIMRVYTTGTPEDQRFVADQIFGQITLKPLSAYRTPYTPPDNVPVNPSIDTITQPIQQLDSLDACAFFGTMSAMMRSNPPRTLDAAVVPILERLGLIGTPSATDTPAPTQFSCAHLTGTEGQAEKTALQLAVATGKRLLAATPPPSLTPTNWSVSLNVGDYGVQYLLRALVAKDAIGANRPQDAVYAYGGFDSGGTSDNNRLYGTNRYVLHFQAPTNQKGPWEIPPIDGNGFWSITLYNADGTLVDNQVASYHALSTKPVEAHTACPNSDGSLDVYVQATPPSDPQQLCNWLEAPQPTANNNNGQFILLMRMYWPDPTILNGTWYPPAIQKTN